MFFNKSRSQLSVKFEESKNNQVKTYVKVDYSKELQDLEFVAQDFYLYYLKVLQCLGKNDPSYSVLLNIISNGIKNILDKKYSIMKDNSYELEFIDDIGEVDWKCSAKFYDNSLPITKFDYGKEGYYASMSCIAFLQYIKEHVEEKELIKLKEGISKILMKVS